VGARFAVAVRRRVAGRARRTTGDGAGGLGLAAVRSVAIVVRSTPASAVVWAWVICRWAGGFRGAGA